MRWRSRNCSFFGEPGAGKSTFLLELARYLVEQAEADASKPLPILLPLSSWAEHKRPLNEWLGEEMARLYDVPPRLSQQWIQTEQALPLLDGLDEMEEANRPACIAAINAYHREHLQPLVVCSRTSEYDAATRHERLALHTAVVVQPLSPGQVDTYLATLGEPLTKLRDALETNTLLQELATTPLLLQVLLLTYHGTSTRALSQNEAQVQEQIWTDYVQRMVRDKGDGKRYPLPVTVGWLRWLASEMRSHNQAIFSLESLQPSWLSAGRRNLYRWSIELVGLLVVGLVVGLIVGLVSLLVSPLVVMLAGMLDQLDSMPAGIMVGITVSVSIGLFSVLLVILFVDGLGQELVASLLGGRDIEIKPAETLTWSWKNLWSWLEGALLLSVFVGMLLGMLASVLLGLLSDGQQSIGQNMGNFVELIGVGVGLLVGLLIGLLVGGLVTGFSGNQLTERQTLSPNEGIHRSLKNGALLFAGCLLVGPLLGGLVGSIFGNPLGGLRVGLVAGLIAGLIDGLSVGLGAGARHYILRFWLSRSSIFPWRATLFLEDATARMILRRVGGGYSFVHRLLLDYFADGSKGMLGLVRIEEGKELGRVYEIRKDGLSIGRSRDSNICLEDLAVSRLHASIVHIGNGNYALKDEGSANGTKVNGQLVAKDQLLTLQEGDRIQLGKTVLVFGRQ